MVVNFSLVAFNELLTIYANRYDQVHRDARPHTFVEDHQHNLFHIIFSIIYLELKNYQVNTTSHVDRR